METMYPTRVWVANHLPSQHSISELHDRLHLFQKPLKCPTPNFQMKSARTEKCQGVVVQQRMRRMDRYARLGRTVVICTCCVSAQHRPNPPFPSDGRNIPSTWGGLRPRGTNSAKFGPWLQPQPNLAPTRCNLEPRPTLKSTWLQNRGHGRPNPKSSKHAFSLVFPKFLGHQ